MSGVASDPQYREEGSRDDLLHHYLLTKFNLPLDYAHRSGQHLDESWLSHRWSLFQDFCLPSVFAQSDRRFTWVIYCSDATPDPYRSQLDGLAAQEPWIAIVYLATSTCGEHLEDWAAGEGRQPASYLLTSRLDNDDAIASEYMSHVRTTALRYAAERVDQILRPHLWNFPVGFQYAGGKAYARIDPRGPFLSMLEQPDGTRAKTVLSVSHRLAPSMFETTQLWTRPAWLQVVHGQNLANGVSGIRWLSDPAACFGLNLPDAPLRESRISAIAEVGSSAARYLGRVVRRVLRPLQPGRVET